jgi:hypothetical protein
MKDPELETELEVKKLETETELEPELEVKKLETELEENIVRILCKNILEYTSCGLNDKKLGIIYTYIHLVYSFLIGFVFLFNNNLLHLSILLMIISINTFAIVIFHGCPLTHLEKKYLNTSTCSEYYGLYRNSKIMYKCDHDYERQIEMLTNVFLLVALKCLTILFLRTFDLKLYNYNYLY